MAQSSITIERVSNRVSFPAGHSKEILALFSGSMKQEFPMGETPKQAATFISRFMKVKCEFPQSDFRAPGWVCSTTTSWWAKMVSFVLRELEEPLLQCGLYPMVKSVCYKIILSYYNFFGILEKITRTLAHSLLQLGQ